MAQDINNVTLTGRLTKDAEARNFQNGTVYNIALAVNEETRNPQTQKYEESPNFIDVQYSSKNANMGQYLQKGRQVAITGRLHMDSWTDKNTQQKRTRLVVRARQLNLLGGGQNAGSNGQTGNSRQAAPQQAAPQQVPVDAEPFGEDIPF